MTIDRTKDRLLRLPEVLSRTSLSRTEVYRRIARGEFPAPIKIGQFAVAWYESDVGRWVAAPMEWREAA